MNTCHLNNDFVFSGCCSVTVCMYYNNITSHCCIALDRKLPEIAEGSKKKQDLTKNEVIFYKSNGRSNSEVLKEMRLVEDNIHKLFTLVKFYRYTYEIDLPDCSEDWIKDVEPILSEMKDYMYIEGMDLSEYRLRAMISKVVYDSFREKTIKRVNGSDTVHYSHHSLLGLNQGQLRKLQEAINGYTTA